MKENFLIVVFDEVFVLINKLILLGNGIIYVWIYIYWYKGKLEFEDLGFKIFYNKFGN